MGLSTSTEKPLRIMIVGDSMTHGQEGDWTWRYRFWQWLSEHKPLSTFAFVGPWTGTQAPVAPGEQPEPGPRATGGYAHGIDKRFTGHHFAAWGRAVCQDMDIIKDQVAQHRPDILLVMLGFNDMGWFISDAKGTLKSMETFVASARAANTSIKLAIANVPQRSFMDGRQDLIDNTTEYNDSLARVVPEWSTTASPVKLVRLCETYQCQPEGCPAGYDGLHPNALGDYQIARAFSQTIVSDFHDDFFGDHHGHDDKDLQVPPLKVPSHIPPRPIAVPVNVRAFGRPARVKLTWDRVYGAYGYDVQHRPWGATDPWHFNVHNDERHDVLGLTSGDIIELRVRMTCGNDVCSDWSDIVSATAL